MHYLPGEVVSEKNQFRRSDIKMGIFKRWLSANENDITRDFDPKVVLGIKTKKYHKNEFDSNDMELINGGI